jgi:hypothetical protein
LGTVVAIVGVFVIGWLGLRKMTATQQALAIDAGVVSTASSVVVPPIPPGLVEDAKTPVLRLDVVLRVDGVDVTADGAPACREGNRHLIGRGSDGANGSFDENALVACIRKLCAERAAARPIAIVSRAGPAVPVTYFDALVAALGRAGVADVVKNR